MVRRVVLLLGVVSAVGGVLVMSSAGAGTPAGANPRLAARVAGDAPAAVGIGGVALLGDSLFDQGRAHLLAVLPAGTQVFAAGGLRVDQAQPWAAEIAAGGAEQVVVELGGNDAIQTMLGGWTLADTWPAMETMLASFPDAACVHVVLVPAHTAIPILNELLDRVNERWRGLAAADARVSVVDFERTIGRSLALAHPTPTRVDRLHLNDLGNQLLAEQVRLAVEGCDAAATLRVRAYHDLDADGTRDAEEPPVPLGSAELLPDVTRPPVTEDAAGAAIGPEPTFTGVAPGDYVVALRSGALAPGLQPAGGAWSTPVEVVGGSAEVVELAVVEGGAAVTGRIVLDQDHDGAAAPGELGLAHAGVRLVPAATDTAAGVEERTTTAGADGTYAFTDVAPGRYRIEVEPPTIHRGPGIPSGPPPEIDVGVGSRVEVDVGFDRPPVTVGAEVYLDQDGIEGREPGDPALTGVAYLLIELETTPAGSLQVTDVHGIGFADPSGRIDLSARLPADAQVGLLLLPLVPATLSLRSDLEAVGLPGDYVDVTPGEHTEISVGFRPLAPAEPTPSP